MKNHRDFSKLQTKGLDNHPNSFISPLPRDKQLFNSPEWIVDGNS